MPTIGYTTKEIKQSSFYKKLESKLATKSIAIDGMKTIGYATIGGQSTKRTELYISDGQVATLFVLKSGKLLHLEVDGITLMDREEKITESKLADDLSKYIGKKSKIKLKKEMNKKIDLPNGKEDEVDEALVKMRDELKAEIAELEKQAGEK